MFAKTIERFGRVDGLVNNAATNPYFGPLVDTPDAAIDKTIEVNVRGYLNCIRAFVKHARTRGGGGSIVNIASVAGTRAAPMQAHLRRDESGRDQRMTQTLGFELGSSADPRQRDRPGLVDQVRVRDRQQPDVAGSDRQANAAAAPRAACRDRRRSRVSTVGCVVVRDRLGDGRRRRSDLRVAIIDDLPAAAGDGDPAHADEHRRHVAKLGPRPQVRHDRRPRAPGPRDASRACGKPAVAGQRLAGRRSTARAPSAIDLGKARGTRSTPARARSVADGRRPGAARSWAGSSSRHCDATLWLGSRPGLAGAASRER